MVPKIESPSKGSYCAAKLHKEDNQSTGLEEVHGTALAENKVQLLLVRWIELANLSELGQKQNAFPHTHGPRASQASLVGGILLPATLQAFLLNGQHDFKNCGSAYGLF